MSSRDTLEVFVRRAIAAGNSRLQLTMAEAMQLQALTGVAAVRLSLEEPGPRFVGRVVEIRRPQGKPS